MPKLLSAGFMPAGMCAELNPWWWWRSSRAFIPKTPTPPHAGRSCPAETQLMSQLGFDSLAITEVVFATEDLLGIRIANEEILQVLTLDDLRGFIRRKAGAIPPR